MWRLTSPERVPLTFSPKRIGKGQGPTPFDASVPATLSELCAAPAAALAGGGMLASGTQVHVVLLQPSDTVINRWSASLMETCIASTNVAGARRVLRTCVSEWQTGGSALRSLLQHSPLLNYKFDNEWFISHDGNG